MSLREGITKIIAEARGEYYDTYHNPDSDYSDKILKLIEKRIDERANLFLNKYSIDMINLDLLVGRAIDEIPSQIAYLKALGDIKKMLK